MDSKGFLCNNRWCMLLDFIVECGDHHGLLCFDNDLLVMAIDAWYCILLWIVRSSYVLCFIIDY